MMQVLLVESDLEEPDNDGYTPLMMAANAGLNTAAQTLLAYGASVKATDRHSRTAFMLAVVNGHLQVVQMMLEPLKFPPKLNDAEDVLVVHEHKHDKERRKSRSPDRKDKKHKKDKDKDKDAVKEASG